MCRASHDTSTNGGRRCPELHSPAQIAAQKKIDKKAGIVRDAGNNPFKVATLAQTQTKMKRHYKQDPFKGLTEVEARKVFRKLQREYKGVPHGANPTLYKVIHKAPKPVVEPVRLTLMKQKVVTLAKQKANIAA